MRSISSALGAIFASTALLSRSETDALAAIRPNPPHRKQRFRGKGRMKKTLGKSNHRNFGRLIERIGRAPHHMRIELLTNWQRNQWARAGYKNLDKFLGMQRRG